MSRNATIGAFRLYGDLDEAALEQALKAVASRHEILRSRYVRVGDAFAHELISPPPEVLTALDAPADPATLAPDRLAATLRAQGCFDFDLWCGPLARSVVFRIAPSEHLLVHIADHSVFDLWSWHVFAHELEHHYNTAVAGRSDALPPLPIQYHDYARREREWLSGPTLDALLSHWRGLLADAPHPLTLPRDVGAEPATAASGPAATVFFDVPEHVLEPLRAATVRLSATPFMIFVAALVRVVRDETGRSDVVVGSEVANRTIEATHSLIGFFVNPLPVRVRIPNAARAKSIAERVRAALLDVYAHQSLPLVVILQELEPDRSVSENGFFRIFVSMRQGPHGDGVPQLSGLHVEQLEITPERTHMDVAFYFSRHGPRFRCAVVYDRSAFSASRIDALFGAWIDAVCEVTATDGTA